MYVRVRAHLEERVVDDGQPVGAVQQGAQDNILADMNGNGVAINIDSEATTYPSLLINGQTTNGGMLELVNAGALTSIDGSGRAGLMWLEATNAATTKPILAIKNAGTGSDMRIYPRDAATSTCTMGDIYFDSSGAFCACTATNTWENTVSTGTCV